MQRLQVLPVSAHECFRLGFLVDNHSRPYVPCSGVDGKNQTERGFKHMKRVLAICGLVIVAGTIVLAQEIPMAEAYAGFTWVRVNPSNQVNAFTAVGGLGAVQYNFNRSFGVVGE